MRLPLQKQSSTKQRQLLRQLIWSLCLVAPGSLAVADESTDKKVEPTAAPTLALPTFPTAALPAPVSSTSPAPTSQPAVPKSQPAVPTSQPAVPKSQPTVPGLLPPPPAASAKPIGSKDGVIITMPRALETAKPSSSTAAKDNDPVAIKFASPSGPATSGSLSEAPSSFRLSDKSTAPPSAGLPDPASLKQSQPIVPSPQLANTPPATTSLKFSDQTKIAEPPKLNVRPETTAQPLTQAKQPERKLSSANLPVAAPKLPAANLPAAKVTEPAAASIGALTVSKEGMGPSKPASNELKREAVLIRPKAIVLGRAATELAQADTDIPQSSEVKTPGPASVSKPSTAPQALATSSAAAQPTTLKSVDSKLSSLPPSQLSNVPVPLAVQPVEPSTLLPEFQTPPVTIATAPKMTTEGKVEPKVPAFPALPAPSAPPAPPSLATTSTSRPVAVASQAVVTGAKDTNVADVAPQASGLVLTDSVQPPVVADAVLVTGSTLASARKYSKPADRTIQVGTIALTTMRVGGRDVLKCEVDDSSVCRAIVTADGEVALLPGKVGVTRATLWIKEPNGQPKVETADIQVGETLPIDGKDSVEIEKLNESLQRLYPNTTLRIVASDRCIEICGEADTEQQAREVLQLVRKLCLVPVKDKVTVR